MALETEGWIIFDSGGGEEMKVPGKWKIRQKNTGVKIRHTSSDLHYGWDKRKIQRTITITELYFSTRANAELFLEYIDLLNATVNGFKLELQVHSDNSKFKLKGGTATSMMVLCTDYSGVEKVSLGDTQVYKIASLKLEQAT